MSVKLAGDWKLRDTFFGPAVDAADGSAITGPLGLRDSDHQVARLIAAAPDMRAALEMVAHCHIVKDGVNGQQMWLTHQSVIDAVNAAILKATQGA